jgi:hypothetical protein
MPVASAEAQRSGVDAPGMPSRRVRTQIASWADRVSPRTSEDWHEGEYL